MNPFLKELIFWFAIYMIGVLVVYFIICYKNAKIYIRKYEVELSDNDIFMFVFWPIAILVYIFIMPFKLIQKLALNIKRITNPIKVQAKDIIK